MQQQPTQSGAPATQPQKSKRNVAIAILIIAAGIVVAVGIISVANSLASSIRQQAAKATKPEMPITVTYRKSLVGEGYVAQFFNRSDRHLVVVAELENPTLHAKKSGGLEIAPRATVELGWAEGWKFVSGDTIKLHHAEYSDLSGRIP